MARIEPTWRAESGPAVLFIHGVNGHWRKTWKTTGSSFFWPEELGRREGWFVGSIDYEVNTNWGRETMPLEDRARALLQLIHTEPDLRDRDLALVTHSFGGLVAKQMVRTASDYPQDFGWFTSRLAGTVFLATPHQGAGLGSFLTFMGKLLGSTVTTRDVRSNSPQLRDLGDWYREHFGDLGLRALTLYEMQRTKLGFLRTMMVVTPASANPGIKGVVPIPVDADHVTIAKPDSDSHVVFRSTVDFLEQAFELPAELGRLKRQAAAIPYRRNPGLELLLVRTTGGRWTFPKGHIDPGQTLSQAAEVEAFEEAGVRGRIHDRPLITYLHAKRELKDRPVREYAVTGFLLEVTQQGKPQEKRRSPTWHTPDKARAALCEDRSLVYCQWLERVVDAAVEALKSKATEGGR